MGRPKGSKTKKEAVTLPKKPVPPENELVYENAKVPKVSVNDKLEKLKKLMNEVNRDCGSNALKFASEEPELDRISFKNKDIDDLTGGGVAQKRFTIIWGPKSAGKTTLCYNLIAEAQSKGKVCAFIDMERTFDPKWATKMGVKLDELVLGSEYETAESAMDDFIKITKAKAADLIILDSVQALSPKGEQETKKGKEKSLEDDTMALLARKLSQFFRISSGSVYKSNVSIVLVGQARTNLGGFIAFDSLSGGHALQHWSSMTLRVTRGPKSESPIKKTKVDGKTVEETIGFSCSIKLEKRKIESAVEGSEVNIPFYFEDGFPKADA